jgi:NhaP-type Na+/H+ or K+/H+ antiporter
MLIVAIAMVAGVLAQILGRHGRIPGIVLLLVVGIVLGPDVLGVIQPRALGAGLEGVLGFAVAVILFEGSMRLDIAQLRRQSQVIRRLVIFGALVTTIGGAIAARVILDWDWRTSFLFGTLVIVTGPTVVSPLVRRIKLAPSLAVILEAEAVFIDAVGASIAVVALELALQPIINPSSATWNLVERLIIGVGIGACGGLVLGLLLRVRGLVPRGTENILVLSAAVALYQLSQAIAPESGLLASVAAGLVVGNLRIHRIHELAEFKEQLTVLLIGVLFVLLAADVRLSTVESVGPRALAVVVALMVFVRPLVVWLATRRAGMDWREIAFISWVGPRGIVAAAVASLFASQLARRGLAGGTELRALVFVVIGVTVTVQGLTAGPIARLLGLRRASNTGYLILGANPIATYLARRLQTTGQTVELIDTDTDDIRRAEEAGLHVLFGNGLDPRTLIRARVDSRRCVIAATPSESVNLLFARRIADESDPPVIFAALEPTSIDSSQHMVRAIDAHILFGRGEDLAAWSVRWRHNQGDIIRRMYVGASEAMPAVPANALLPLTVEHAGSVALVDERTHLRDRDIIELAVAHDTGAAAETRLAERGWLEVAGPVRAPVKRARTEA